MHDYHNTSSFYIYFNAKTQIVCALSLPIVLNIIILIFIKILKIYILTAVDIKWLLTATIIYLKCLNAGTIPWLLLKTMVIPRFCVQNNGNPKSLWNTKKFYINPRPLFYPIMSVLKIYPIHLGIFSVT